MKPGEYTSSFSFRAAAVFLAVCAAATVTVSASPGVGVKVLGQSGKFTLYRLSEGEGDANKVVVTMDALSEVDASGAEVGQTGSVKHSINSFATQNFEISPAVTATLGNVSVSKISFETDISSIGHLKVDTYVSLSRGNVSTDNETWILNKDDVKFNVVLSNWTWCNPCGSGANAGVGDAIVLDISIKGNASKAGGSSGDKDYNLGGGVELSLSDRVLVDGAWTTMGAGFPAIVQQGSKDIFRFRFPKFSQNATYDPIIGMSGAGSGSDSGSDLSSAAALFHTTQLFTLCASLALAIWTQRAFLQ